MRTVRWAVAVLVGAALAVAVAVWPVRPMWTVAYADNGSPAGFGPASREIAMTEDDRLRWYDVATGRPTRETPLTAPPGRYLGYVSLSPDGERVTLVEEPMAAGPPEAAFVLDARTGAKLCGPFPPAGTLTLSPCGRWLLRGERAVVTLHDVTTGRPVAAVAATDANAAFSPDGDHLAVVRQPGAGPATVDLIACRTGASVRQVVLPPVPPRWVLAGWDARGLYLDGDDPAAHPVDLLNCFGGSGRESQGYLLAPWAATPTPMREPIRDVGLRGRTSRASGPGWLVRLTDRPPDPSWADAAKAWLRRTVGRPPTPALRRSDPVTARRYDAETGRLLAEVGGLHGWCVVSPDGRRVAVLDVEEHTFSMWNLAPWPRWLVAAAAGAAPLGGAWLIGRRKRRAA